MAIRVGIGGWTFPPWRGVFYPEGLPHARELAHAGALLRTIEINGTFYRTPTAKSCAAWASQTPEGFVFALKATRYAVARRRLAEAEESVRKFIDSGIVELADKLGPINWQLPPTKAFDAEDLSAFLALLPKAHQGVGLRHALEVRHDSFLCPEFIQLARAQGVAVVFADHPHYPAIANITADFVYARLQQARPEVETGYDADALAAWADAARCWARGAPPPALPRIMDRAPEASAAGDPATGKSDPVKDVFIFLINGAKIRAPAGALALQSQIDRDTP